MNDPWEQIRHLTLDQIVTRVKLASSASSLSNLQLNGYTTPEGYPFELVLFIGKPGNEAAMDLMKKLKAELMERARTVEAAANPNLRRPGKNPTEADK